MTAAFQRVYHGLTSRPVLRAILQALVSLGLIVLLIHLAKQSNLAESLGRLCPTTIAMAAALGLAQVALATWRWQILLRQVGVPESLLRLGMLYVTGLFFSLFLPTSTGGDAVRVYEVARRSGRPAQAFLATLQERSLGLASALLVGAVATFYYLPILPPELRFWAVLLQLTGAAGLAAILYPALLIRLVRQLRPLLGRFPLGTRLTAHPQIARLIKFAQPVAELPPLPVGRLALLSGVGLGGTLLGVAMYSTVSADLQIQAGFLAFCLVVPLVWIVRMAPVSVNGIGVGEGAFVFLLGIFDVPKGPALALALTMLGLQTGLALLGGLVLVLGMVGKTREMGRKQAVLRTDTAHHERQPAPHRRAA